MPHVCRNWSWFHMILEICVATISFNGHRIDVNSLHLIVSIQSLTGKSGAQCEFILSPESSSQYSWLCTCGDHLFSQICFSIFSNLNVLWVHCSSSAQLKLICVNNRTGEASATPILSEDTALHDLWRHAQIAVLLPNLKASTFATSPTGLSLLLLLLLLLRGLLVLLRESSESLTLLHVDSGVHGWRHLFDVVGIRGLFLGLGVVVGSAVFLDGFFEAVVVIILGVPFEKGQQSGIILEKHILERVPLIVIYAALAVELSY